MRIFLPILVVTLGLNACKGSGEPAAPATVEKSEPKPAEAKPAEAKPAEAKPAEAKPAEVKPEEAKPAEVKPAEAKTEDEPTKPADPAAPAAGGKAYTKDGVGLTVPDGWSVTLDEVDAEDGYMRTIHVENDSSGLVIISCFKDIDLSSEQLLKSTLDEMGKVTEPARIEVAPGLTAVTETFGGTERAGHQGRYTVVLGDVRVPHTASAFPGTAGELKCILLKQASDDEIADYKKQFETIFSTFAAVK